MGTLLPEHFLGQWKGMCWATLGSSTWMDVRRGRPESTFFSRKRLQKREPAKLVLGLTSFVCPLPTWKYGRELGKGGGGDSIKPISPVDEGPVDELALRRKHTMNTLRPGKFE